MCDRKLNTLIIEVEAVPGNYGYGPVIWALAQVCNALADGTIKNAKVTKEPSGREIGMATMVYREPKASGAEAERRKGAVRLDAGLPGMWRILEDGEPLAEGDLCKAKDGRSGWVSEGHYGTWQTTSCRPYIRRVDEEG